MSSLPSLPTHCKAYSSFYPHKQLEQHEDFYNIDLQLHTNTKEFSIAVTHMERMGEEAEALGHVYMGTYEQQNDNSSGIKLKCIAKEHKKFNNYSACEGGSNTVTVVNAAPNAAEEYFIINYKNAATPIIEHMPKSFQDTDDFENKQHFSMTLSAAPHEGYLSNSYLQDQQFDE